MDLRTVGRGKGDDMHVKSPLQPPRSSTHSQDKARDAKSRSLPWGWSPVCVPPGLRVRGAFETRQLKSWLNWKGWEYCHCFGCSTLILLHNVKHINLHLKYMNIR